MEKKGKKIPQETRLLWIGAGLLVVILAIVVTAFTFLVNYALPAFTPDDEIASEKTVHFNLEGFEELGL